MLLITCLNCKGELKYIGKMLWVCQSCGQIEKFDITEQYQREVIKKGRRIYS